MNTDWEFYSPLLLPPTVFFHHLNIIVLKGMGHPMFTAAIFTTAKR